ncbi:MAG: hypothetical protein ACRD30_10610 [Bryobacteraceae bacterium]
MPPARTGVADYAAALLPALRKFGRVELDDPRADIALYQLGNNPLHREIYRRAIANPGVAVVHDAVMHHFFMGILDESAYTDEFVYNYGEWMRGMAGELWRDRARSAADPRYFEYPMLKRVGESSHGVVVHNPAAAAIVKRHAPGARVFEIPHLFVPPELPSAAETAVFRAALGIAPETLLVGVFGHLRESKRIAVLLRAMHEAWNRGAPARLLVAGAFVSSDLERALAPLLRDPRILRAGYLAERDFWRYASPTDLCVNLRYPTAGESSGIAVRMMGIGKAVALTEGAEIARIPENACLRIDPGAAEEEMLAESICWLASDRRTALEIGARAARHIAAEHSADRAAALFWDAMGSL